MEKTFDTLIDSFINDNIGIAENFLTAKLAAHLKENLTALYNHKAMQFAGTGNETLVTHNKLVRSDKIYWLDRAHNNEYENDFFDLMDRFVAYLNSTCFTGITGYEFHYTMYEKGSFYKRHLDQFQHNQSRQYSMIFYLNEGWKLADGGELCIYNGEESQNISPDNGKSVFFKSSQLEHEVLLSNKARLSITGWLKVN